jgi:glycosyltransferase involved in cell wall biosynthesis
MGRVAGKRLRVAVLGHAVWGGIWGHSLELAMQLSKHLDVVYIEPVTHRSHRSPGFVRTHDSKPPANLTIIGRDLATPLGLRYGLLLELMNLRALMRIEHDVVVSYYYFGMLLSTLFSRVCRRRLFFLYVDDYTVFNSWVAQFATKVFMPILSRFANGNIVTAQKLADDIRRFTRKVEHIPNGVDLSTFRSVHKPPKKQRLSRNFTVGFVGSFTKKIDFQLVLDAARELKNIDFVLVGSGEQYETVQVRSQQMENVILAGMLSHEETAKRIAQMDVCLIPYRRNRQTDRISPVKLFEYWAMGKPVISTRCYEIERLGKDAVLFANNAKDLITWVKKLKDEERLREQLIKKGLEEVVKYDWNQLGQEFLARLADAEA